MRSSQQCPVFQRYLGNNEAIDSQHYLQVTEVHFAKAVQQAAVLPRTGSQAAVTEDEKTPVLQGNAGGCDHLPDDQVPPAGIELKPYSSGRVAKSKTGAAKSAAVGDDLPPIDPELASVIEAWPTLPPAIREVVLAMLRAAE
tara:strand:+ start:195 stop:620 length:426 start_codon:yes stop_codon:yes gene_type:complete